MCRAARGNIEVAGEFGHFAHEPDKPVLTAAGEPRLALLLNRPAHLVAARQAVDFGAVLSQSCQKMRQILQLLGDDMDDTTFLLHGTGDGHIACA